MTQTPLNQNDFPANVADGTVASRWSTGANQTNGQYFQVDFGGTVSLTQVVMDASNNVMDYPRGYDIGMSAAGTTFTSVAMGNPTTPVVTVNFNAAQGRYLRITQTGAVTAYWSIDELRLMCSVPGYVAGQIDPYDSQYWKAIAPKAAANNPPSNAIDADATSRWSTGAMQAPGDTFTVDMGAVAMISGVNYTSPAADFPNAYTLSLSTDCTNYAAPVAMGAGAAGTMKLTFARQNARCFKMTQTGTPTATSWWSITNISLTP
jgi:hypothetical protein